MKLSEHLRERGYVYQHSSETLEELTDSGSRTVYLGIDPSADSLHVGNLMGLLVLRCFLEAGHRVIIVMGGGTGMIGDPGGKSEERNLLDAATVAKNAAAVASQIRRVFGRSDFIEENNAAWLGSLSLIDFLRDVGKYFTVNAMLKKDIVRDRLEQELPISFTEFSYSLLQGYDFLHLNEAYGCDVQVGGSDQWSNILAGVDFIRRKVDRTVYALTWPLIINKSTGKKFGKSEQGAVWLDAGKTSVFSFYQFFLNVEDTAVEELLLKLTMLSREKITEVMTVQTENPAARFAQRRLAWEVTALVHGEEAANRAERISEALFGNTEIDGEMARELAQDSRRIQSGAAIVDVLVETGLAESKREARQLIEGGAVTVNSEQIDASRAITTTDLQNGIAVIRRGKRAVRIVSF